MSRLLTSKEKREIAVLLDTLGHLLNKITRLPVFYSSSPTWDAVKPHKSYCSIVLEPSKGTAAVFCGAYEGRGYELEELIEGVQKEILREGGIHFIELRLPCWVGYDCLESALFHNISYKHQDLTNHYTNKLTHKGQEK